MAQKGIHFSKRLDIFSVVLCFSLFSGATQAAEYTNFLNMKIVEIPSGSFKMGLPSNTLDVGKNEFPQHDVSVQSFPMSTTEVTLGQFKQFIIAAKRMDIVTDDFMNANSRSDNAPVVYVSWNDIKDFLSWLNANKPANDKGTYRLPNEAEWEYACHAGSYDPYCGGRMPSAVAWHVAISGSHQQEVGRKQANAFGLYDMSGNAREWVEDCYHENYENAPVDGSTWTAACASNDRVQRGGSWNAVYHKARATIRFNAPSVSRSIDTGFRVVREVSSSSKKMAMN